MSDLPPATSVKVQSTGRKILTREELAAAVARARSEGRKIAFTNGCFDLLHVGHIRYLAAARRLADLLVVAINDDDSVRRQNKGPGRPILPCDQRCRVLASLRCVDFVTDFSEDTPHALLDLLRPEVLVKGANYGIDGVVGREEVEAYGGRVAVVELTPGRSTTGLLRRAAEGGSGDKAIDGCGGGTPK